MKILVANLGSTSLKYRLYEFSGAEERLLTRGGFERVTDYAQTIEECLAALQSGGWISGEGDLAAVGFKTVLARGISGCVRLDESVLKAMADYNGIAPAHNPPYITGIRLFSKRMPRTPMIGLFETAFYQWMTPAATRYAVPEKWYELGVRRLGFHGASHKFIGERSAELLGRPDVAERARRLYVDGGSSPVQGPNLRVVSCHLGGSSSVTGIRNGVAIGNSMGLSPQSGLPHNNRVGDLDSFALPYLMQTHGYSVETLLKEMQGESGLKGLSGTSNDVRDIMNKASQGDAAAQVALEVLVQQTRHWIGAFQWELNGLDALVFTAGIGENQVELRESICAGLDQVGLVLDAEKNRSIRGTEGEISASNSAIKVWVIPTNEELVVAREAKRFLEKGQ